MEGVVAAILGLNATLVGALIWMLKHIFTRLFGSEKDPGLVSSVNMTLQSMNTDIKENTAAIRELKTIIKENTHGQTSYGPDRPFPS